MMVVGVVRSGGDFSYTPPALASTPPHMHTHTHMLKVELTRFADKLCDATCALKRRFKDNIKL